MSVEIACECGDGFGLPHSHVVVGPYYEYRDRDLFGWVRLWVDWKAVARA